VNKWLALGLMMVLAFLNYLDRNLLSSLQPFIQAELDLTNVQLGALGTGFTIVYAATAPLLGVVADRIARKTILMTALIAWSCVTALSGLATGFVSLVIWRSLTGLGEGGYFPTAASLIGDFFPPARRGLAFALHGAACTLGGSVGLALGGVLGARLGWRNTFFLAIVPGLLLAGLVWLRFREPPRGGASAEPSTGPRPRYFSIVLAAPVLLIATAALGGALATNGLTHFMPKYLHEARAMTEEDAGILTGIGFAATLIGQLSGGILSDHLSSRMRGARPLLAGLAYGSAVIAFLMITRVPTVELSVVCYGFCMVARGFAEPNFYGTVIDAVRPDGRGAAQGFMLLLTFGGASLSTALAGYLIDRSGYGAAFLMMTVASAGSAIFAIALMTVLRRRGA
jgi:MFS transporter, Spinster family, sphingosine-1-phosphate transporter